MSGNIRCSNQLSYRSFPSFQRKKHFRCAAGRGAKLKSMPIRRILFPFQDVRPGLRKALYTPMRRTFRLPEPLWILENCFQLQLRAFRPETLGKDGIFDI